MDFDRSFFYLGLLLFFLQFCYYQATNCSLIPRVGLGDGSFRLPLFDGYRSVIASTIPKRINVFTADVY